MIKIDPVGMFVYKMNADQGINRKYLFGRRGDGKGWCCPGGKTDPGESALEAVYREMIEETNVEIPMQFIKYIGSVQTFDNFEGVNTHMISRIYKANFAEASNGQHLHTTEELVELKWLTIDEAMKERLFMPTKQAILKFRYML
jgi:ADP-ribose pyrophosphatase YjhB (NUDIX family)